VVIVEIRVTFVWRIIGENNNRRVVLLEVLTTFLRNNHGLAVENLVHECGSLLTMEFVEDDEVVGCIETVEEVFGRSATVGLDHSR